MFTLLTLAALTTQWVTAAATCPSNQVIDGRSCTVTCGQDRPGGDYGNAYTGSFQACIQACGKDSKCETAQFHTANGYCYFKNSVNPAVASSGTDSVVCSSPPSSFTPWATTTPPATTTMMTCPAASTVTVTDTVTSTLDLTLTATNTATETGSPSPTPDAFGCSTGRTSPLRPVGKTGTRFVEVCYSDYFGGDMAGNPICEATFDDCVNSCANTTGCIGAVFDKTVYPAQAGFSCYLKRLIEPWAYNPARDAVLLLDTADEL